MGYYRHHAIVVTDMTFRRIPGAPMVQPIDRAHAKAVELGMTVTPLVSSPLNGFESFMIAPDGSKEGWHDSDKGDAAREAWVAWLKGSGEYIDWAIVAFGGDDRDLACVIDNSRNEKEEEE